MCGEFLVNGPPAPCSGRLETIVVLVSISANRWRQDDEAVGRGQKAPHERRFVVVCLSVCCSSFCPPLIHSPHPLPKSFHPLKTSFTHHVSLSTAAAEAAPLIGEENAEQMPVLSGVVDKQWRFHSSVGSETFFWGPVLPWLTRSCLSFRCAEDRFHKDLANDGARGGAGLLITAEYARVRARVHTCVHGHALSIPSSAQLTTPAARVLGFNLPVSHFLHFYIPNCITSGLCANKCAK